MHCAGMLKVIREAGSCVCHCFGLSTEYLDEELELELELEEGGSDEDVLHRYPDT